MFLFRTSLLLLALTSAVQAARVPPDRWQEEFFDFERRFAKGKNITLGGYLDEDCTQRNDTGNVTLQVVGTRPTLCLLVNGDDLASAFLVESWVEGGKRRNSVFQANLVAGPIDCQRGRPRNSDEFSVSEHHMLETADFLIDTLHGVACNDGTPLGWAHLKVGEPLLKDGDGPFFDSGLYGLDHVEPAQQTQQTTSSTTNSHSKSGAMKSSAAGSICWVVVTWWYFLGCRWRS
mmetsp:Transcript_41772/g.75833  ORF Transcript_41772/g.75833 Transcript_41772/m.75833 type:complete len:233 (-) Transcript_41772:89-787(-)